MSLLAAHFDAAQQVMGPGAPDLSLRRHWQRLKCLCPARKEEHYAEPLKTQHPLNRGAVRTEQARNGSSMGRQDYYGNHTMIGEPGASPILHIDSNNMEGGP